MMQMGADGVFIGSGIYKSGDPAARAAACVKATTFFDDAMKCFNLHLRPVEGCYDWKIEGKRLIPKNTAEARKELGLESAAQSASTKVYLCDFCPAKTYVVEQNRKKAGLYE